MEEKIAFVDVETTGTDPAKHGIIQLSAILQIDGIVEARINDEIQPFPDDSIDPQALEVTGHEAKDLMDDSRLKPGIAYDAVTDTLEQYIDKYDSSDKFHFVGYNAYFDSNFVREWFKKNDDPYYGSYFHYPSLDLMQMVSLRYMKHRAKFENYKLMTVCKAMGMDVDPDKAHDALYDVECTMKLFNALREMINWNK